MSECFHFRWPIARKEHRCEYCGDAIPTGQRYCRWCCVQDGSASTVRAHVACDDVAQRAWDEAECYDDEERWVCFDALAEWARGSPAIVVDLAAMGSTWPPGEVARLTALLCAAVDIEEAAQA